MSTVQPIKDFRGWSNYDLNYLTIYTLQKMWAQSECGQDQDKDGMLAPYISRALVELHNQYELLQVDLDLLI